MRDVSAFGTVNDLLADWDAALRRLAELAEAEDTRRLDRPGRPRRPLPGQPRQILQCGANYRKHVVDIVMAERRADHR